MARSAGSPARGRCGVGFVRALFVRVPLASCRALSSARTAADKTRRGPADRQPGGRPRPGPWHRGPACGGRRGDGRSPQGLATTRCAADRTWPAGGPCGGQSRGPGPRTRSARDGGLCSRRVASRAGRRGSEQPRGAEGLPPLLGPPGPISLSWPRAGQFPSAFSISSCKTAAGRAWGWGGTGGAVGDISASPGPPWSAIWGRGCPERCPSATTGPDRTQGDSPSL